MLFGKDEAAAIAWATGSDERNAAVIAETKARADLVIPAELMHHLGKPPT
jgi:hypothetical protein